MQLMLNRRVNELVFLDPTDGQTVWALDHEEAVDLATRILDLAGQIRDTEEAEDE